MVNQNKHFKNSSIFSERSQIMVVDNLICDNDIRKEMKMLVELCWKICSKLAKTMLLFCHNIEHDREVKLWLKNHMVQDSHQHVKFLQYNEDWKKHMIIIKSLTDKTYQYLIN